MKTTKHKIIFSMIMVLVGGLISVTICSNVLKPEAPQQNVTTPVMAALPQTGEISRTLFYSGTLMPKNSITVISKVSGKIEKIFVEAGDIVKKDQRLVQIEDDIVSYQEKQAYSMWQAADAQLERARKGMREEEIENTRALVNQAQEDVTLAEENFERTGRLYESGTIPLAKYEEAENMIRSAQTNLENARRSLKLMEGGASDEEIAIARANSEAALAQYNLAKLQAGFANLEAPEYGIVAAVLADEGNLVGPSTPILAIVQINPIIAKIPVPEKYYGDVLQKRRQITVKIHPSAYPDQKGFSGKISSIAPVIDAMSRTFALEIEVKNPGNLLRPGMYVNVELVLESFAEASLLPESAIVKRNGQKVVFLAEGEESIRARAFPITTGITQNGRVQILSELKPDVPVIVEGNLFLEDQQEVRLIN